MTIYDIRDNYAFKYNYYKNIQKTYDYKQSIALAVQFRVIFINMKTRYYISTLKLENFYRFGSVV